MTTMAGLQPTCSIHFSNLRKLILPPPRDSPVLEIPCLSCDEGTHYVCLSCNPSPSSNATPKKKRRGKPRSFSFASFKALRFHIWNHHRDSNIHTNTLRNCSPKPKLQTSAAQANNEPTEVQHDMGDDFNETTPQAMYRVPLDLELMLRQNDFNYRETIHGMIYKCCNQIEHCNREEVKCRLTHKIAEHFIDIAKVSLTAKQSDSFNNFIRLMCNFVPLKNGRNDGKMLLPSTSGEIRKLILSERKLSWRTLLPCPIVEKLPDGHSYSTIAGLLCHACMTSTSKDYGMIRERHQFLIESVYFVNFCRTVLKKLESHPTNNPTVIVLFIIWSDGFDPNMSSMSNRGSVWALTVTFLFYDIKKGEFYMVKTMVCSVGVDKTDHSFAVFSRIQDEFKTFETSYIRCPSHWHQQPGDVDFHLLPFGCIMDNPERRSNFWLRSCSSKNHLLFGINCRFDRLLVPFETIGCHECQKAVEEYICQADFAQPFKRECTRCLSFSIDRLIAEGTYDCPLVNNQTLLTDPELPLGKLLVEPGFLSSIDLKKGWDYAFDKSVSGVWDQKTAKEYLLHCLCLHDKAIEQFLTHGQEMHHYLQYKKDEDIPQQAMETILSNLSDDPQYYDRQCGASNPIWECFPLPLAFETIMHNCMNTGKALRDFIFAWATDLGMKKELLQSINPRLLAVENLRLDSECDHRSFWRLCRRKLPRFHLIEPLDLPTTQ